MTPTKPPVADDEAMRIAAGLSEDQRERLLEAECCVPDRHPHCICSREYDDLIDLGLARVANIGGIVRTSLGLRVRASLQNGGTGDE